MWKIGLVISAIALIAVMIFTAGGPASAQDSLPQVDYLGEGPNTFTSSLDNFIVKTIPFNFVFQSGPEYTAADGERVWAVRGASGAPPAIWDQKVDMGTVLAGCVVDYVGIDDDLDGRRNRFYVNDVEVELIDEGMTFSGSFTVPEDGELYLLAEDSIAGWRTPCEMNETATPTATGSPEPTETSTPGTTTTPGPSPTASNTPPPGATLTATPSPSPSNTPPPNATMTPEPSATPTGTAESPPTPIASPTTEKKQREDACTRINFEISGEAAVRGLYIVQETGGKELASWYALDGWQDSGWFKGIDISHENVFVKVLFYRGPDTEPVELLILNPAPGTPYGWMSWGVCHALEVGWPGGVAPQGAVVAEPLEQGNIDGAPTTPEPTATSTPETSGSTNDEPDVFGATLNS